MAKEVSHMLQLVHRLAFFFKMVDTEVPWVQSFPPGTDNLVQLVSPSTLCTPHLSILMRLIATASPNNAHCVYPAAFDLNTTRPASITPSSQQQFTTSPTSPFQKLSASTRTSVSSLFTLDADLSNTTLFQTQCHEGDLLFNPHTTMHVLFSFNTRKLRLSDALVHS